jgi:hypothetical protein
MAFPLALAKLETVVLDACSAEEEWPARVAAAIYAGVDFAIAHPEMVEALAPEVSRGRQDVQPYEIIIGRLAGFLKAGAPIDARVPISTDEALVAGVVGLVGDHLRMGRHDRLTELRADLVLLTLLPYLGYSEAQKWANRADRFDPLT